jgi:isoquinoline 1-oxidoreductase
VEKAVKQTPEPREPAEPAYPDRHELSEAGSHVHWRFAWTRRGFLGSLGAGFVVAAAVDRASGSEKDDLGPVVGARLHVGEDGIVTVFSSKVEVGQGSRAQLGQAAAEELRLPVDRVRMVLAETDRVPDDGGTFGSRTTGYTVPDVRKAAAAARGVLVDLAARQWRIEDPRPGRIAAQSGEIVDSDTGARLSFGELARAQNVDEVFRSSRVPENVELTPVDEWKVLGRAAWKPTGREVVTGAHRYPSDIERPGMLRGSILRPPSFGARLAAIDEGAAREIEGAVVARDGDFVGCAAPTSFDARRAVEALSKTAKWVESPHPSTRELFSNLKANVDTEAEARPQWNRELGSVEAAIARSQKTLESRYEVSFIAHAPMEPRAAVAEWTDSGLTVWTGTQRPHGVRDELMKAFELPEEKVHVLVPDTGGGFGGKHTGEVAIEAAKLARAAARPVSLRWTREEEFTWAYFRPAALIEARAGLDAAGAISGWDFTCFNAGSAALESPYGLADVRERYVPVKSPLRQGSYRGLAATANTFARESFMEELASASGADPLEFRLAHLKEPRLRDVLVKAAERFRYQERLRELPVKNGKRGVGIACGTEKGSYVAACVSVKIDPTRGKVVVEEIVEAYECGAIQNPGNLRAQVEGGIIMGLGGALREEIRFENGRVTNPRFSMYLVPRTRDLVPMDVILVDRPDLPSVGAGETPIIAVAPAIAAAVFHATGIRIRTMPIKSDALRTA